MSMWSNSIDVIKHGIGFWQKRTLTRAFVEAQERLGERMYATGIDDGRLGALIAALERRIEREATQSAAKVWVAERRKLILQLAECALEEDALLPGADTEYREAREAQAALESFDQQGAAGKTAFPANRERVAVGV